MGTQVGGVAAAIWATPAASTLRANGILLRSNFMMGLSVQCADTTCTDEGRLILDKVTAEPPPPPLPEMDPPPAPEPIVKVIHLYSKPRIKTVYVNRYVNRYFTMHIDDLPGDEGRATLRPDNALSTNSFTRFEGMAKPIPTLPPVGE